MARYLSIHLLCYALIALRMRAFSRGFPSCATASHSSLPLQNWHTPLSFPFLPTSRAAGRKVKCQVVCASVRNPCRVSPLLNAALALVSAVSPQDWIRCTLMFSDSRSLLQPRLSTVCVWADHWNTRRVGSCHKNMKEVARFQEEDSLDMLG